MESFRTQRKLYSRCLRCQRRLRNKESMIIGIGSSCARKDPVMAMRLRREADGQTSLLPPAAESVALAALELENRRLRSSLREALAKLNGTVRYCRRLEDQLKKSDCQGPGPMASMKSPPNERTESDAQEKSTMPED